MADCNTGKISDLVDLTHYSNIDNCSYIFVWSEAIFIIFSLTLFISNFTASSVA